MGNTFWKAFLGAFWREEENKQPPKVPPTIKRINPEIYSGRVPGLDKYKGYIPDPGYVNFKRIENAGKVFGARSGIRAPGAFDQHVFKRIISGNPLLYNSILNLLNQNKTSGTSGTSKNTPPRFGAYDGGARKTRKNKK